MALDNSKEPSACLQCRHDTALTNTVVQAGVDGRLNVYGASFGNPSAAITYIQFFNKAAADTVTLGTTVPDWVVMLPIGASVQLSPIRALKYFSAGCRYAATTTATGSTAPATAAVATVFFSQS